MTVIEREAPQAKTKGKVIREAWFHGPIYLTDPDTGQVSLFVRRFREIKMPSGRVSIRAMQDVEGYPDEGEMVAAIKDRDMREWEAIDENPPITTVPRDLFSSRGELAA